MGIRVGVTICVWFTILMAEAQNNGRRQGNMVCDRAQERCMDPIEDFKRNHFRDINDFRRTLETTGMDAICRDLLYDFSSCVYNVAQMPECQGATMPYAIVYYGVHDEVAYICSQEGKNLIQSSLSSPCMTDENAYMNATVEYSACIRDFQTQLSGPLSLTRIPPNLCSLMPELANCVIGKLTLTCGNDMGHLAEESWTRAWPQVQAYFGCSTEQNTIQNVIARTLHSGP